MKMYLLATVGLLSFLSVASIIDGDVLHKRRSTVGIASPARALKPIPNYIERGMDWLAEAQYENGGWGSGSNSRQDIRDPHAVPIDPATTAFSAMALMRSGSTLTSGTYHTNIAKALNVILEMVETAPEGDRISNITGTQPQAKLGQHIDVSMVTQFLSDILIHTRHDKSLHSRTEQALSVCLDKLQKTQDADGSWNSRGGWAGVLQSAMANNALEMAQVAGAEVSEDAIDRSRAYQKDNVDTDGKVRTEAAAGVSLYAIASNQRATAKESRRARDIVAAGVRDGRLDAPDVSADNLRRLGYDEEEAARLVDSYERNKASTELLQSETVLTGFGNNGGEEFLSYMMTSEALVLSDETAWNDWYDKMNRRLAKIQNQDGSWSGHHCITSPVFCTAAVIMTISADRNPLNG